MAKGDRLMLAVSTAQTEGVEPDQVGAIAGDPIEAFQFANGATDLRGLTAQLAANAGDRERNDMAFVIEVAKHEQQHGDIKALQL